MVAVDIQLIPAEMILVSGYKILGQEERLLGKILVSGIFI